MLAPAKLNQKGVIPPLLLLAAFGILLFLFIINYFSFQDELFNILFPKKSSYAAACELPDISTATGPKIFNASESVGPGEVVGLQGDRFGTSPEVWITRLVDSSAPTTPQLQLTPITKSDDYVATRIPSDYPVGLYALWVKNGTTLSNPVLVNAARVTSLEFDEVASGNAVRFFGRNLSLAGSTPTAYFVSQGGGSNLNASIQSGSDAYVLKTTSPQDLSVGTTYNIYISNGFGGCYGERLAEETVKGRNGGADPFNLGVPWGADFTFSGNIRNAKTQHGAVGNGIADDQAAIQSAIDTAANAGGGVVYLPAGTYRLGGGGLVVKSKVVLKGDGIDQTIIKYGDGSTGTALNFNNQNTAGVLNMTLQSTALQKTWYGAKAVNASKIFMSGIKWDFYDANVTQADTQWQGSKFLVQNSDFLHRSTRETFALNRFDNVSYLQVRNTKFTYADGRLWVGNYNNHFIFDTNQVYQNGDTNTATTSTTTEDGGIDTYINDMTIMNNTFGILAGTNTTNNVDNDGETILTQLCNPVKQDMGTATGGSLTSLVDTSKNFSAIPNSYYVAIVDGPGAGQWRKIASHTSNTLTVNKPWVAAPANGSKYVIKEWSSEQWLVKGNNLTGLKRAVWMYCGSVDGAIVNNNMTNSDGIWFQPDQRQLKADGSWFGRFELQWNNLIADNVVKNLDGKKPAQVSLFMNQVSTVDIFGIGGLKNEFRRNTVEGKRPSTSSPFNSNLKDGYSAFVNYDPEGGNASRDTDTPGILGTIFEDNTAVNIDNMYHIGTGTWQTVIADSVSTTVGALIKDDKGTGAAIGAKDTVIPPPAAPAPTPTPTPTPSPSPASSASSVQAPYPQTPLTIPGTVQIEEFDTGGEGVAYHDNEALNKGNQYGNTFRTTEGVDAQATSDTGGGSNIAWVLAGEWLEYSVNISTAGIYDIETRAAMDKPGGTFHIEVDGQDKTGPLTVPDTGGTQTWQTVTKNQVQLPAGAHIIKLVMDANGQSGYVGNFNYLKFNLVTGFENGTGLRGTYYNNQDFTSLALSRVDPEINFDWKNGSPDPGVQVDTFSVRWEGQIQPLSTETFTFYTRSDDGVRLWVNNNLLVDKWVTQAPTEYSANIPLTSGQKYNIKVEYYENAYGAVAELRWSSPSVAKQIVPKERLFPSPAKEYTTSFLSDLPFVEVANGWGPVKKDLSNGGLKTAGGNTLTLAGKTYAKGLGAHSYSEVKYQMNGKCTTFTTDAGIDDEEAAQGSAIFQIWADGAKLLETPILGYTSDAQSLSVNVEGKTELKLIASDGGDGISGDHADWADAKITCEK